MSKQYEAKLVYGFPVSTDYKWKLVEFGYDGLYDLLEGEGLKPLRQWNAGVSNGGDPWFLVGIEITKVEDFTRDTAYALVDGTQRAKGVQLQMARAFELLGAAEPVGFYVVGNVA